MLKDTVYKLYFHVQRVSETRGKHGGAREFQKQMVNVMNNIILSAVYSNI